MNQTGFYVPAKSGDPFTVLDTFLGRWVADLNPCTGRVDTVAVARSALIFRGTDRNHFAAWPQRYTIIPQPEPAP